ncbi:transcription termination/antitermination protein NusA [candidate division BRC1 bacterium HGW-BRC1-1]|nr:MAG: transcription termination/antitermination protein NusA [candidate division BRC1 bacterium HGW-BRC1-1]
MNAGELKAFIRLISKEKELEVSVVKDAIEQAIVIASKKNLSQFLDARCDLDAESGELRLFVKKSVVNISSNPRTQISLREAVKLQPGVQIGEDVEIEIPPSALGRIAAQSARQVVMQKLRDAERQKTYEEFDSKLGEVVSAQVLRFDKRDMVLLVGKSEVLLPRIETSPTSHYRTGDRMKVLVLKLDLESKGPIVVVSRTHPQLVSKLFEQEVPEIADGTVRVVNVARDPGSRTKIAVESTNNDVDPVGACVGVKGSRVQMIVRELENEKIDIVPFDENPRHFIASALVPAQIQRIEVVSEEPRKVLVTVKRGNLSLAIGKRGQNARLAAMLTRWKLDIHSEAEEEQRGGDTDEVARKYLDDFLMQLDGWPDGLQEALYESSFNSVQAIAEADEMVLVDFLRGNRELAGTMIQDAREYLEQLTEMTQSQFGDEGYEDGQGGEFSPHGEDDDPFFDGDDGQGPAEGTEVADQSEAADPATPPDEEPTVS